MRGKFLIGDILGSPGDSLEVVLTGEKAGLWTDRADDSGGDIFDLIGGQFEIMFGIGSAEPTPKVVRALERIAKVINARPGRIVVRGHTDGRPFRSETYDNWRLSTARAQMASYMLVRGGVDEGRMRVAQRVDRDAAQQHCHGDDRQH